MESNLSSAKAGGKSEYSKMSNSNERIHNEALLSGRQFNEQNLIEEKIANNMLKVNFCLYLVTLILTLSFVLLSNDIFHISQIPAVDKDRSRDEKLTFSLFSFKYFNNTNNTSTNYSIVNPYKCILNETNCTENNNCKGVKIEYLMNEFGITCEMLPRFLTAGTVVI
jgi:hypothetical protein